MPVALGQFLLNGGSHLHILDGGHRGLDLHNEMGQGLCLLLLALLERTRLGEVNGCHPNQIVSRFLPV